MKAAITITVFIILLFNIALCQEKPLTKEEKKALKEIERQAKAKQILDLVNKKSFVIEADYLSGRSGSKIPVPSTINCILVDTTYAVFQVGSNIGSPGPNGVGGSTIEGKITKYYVKEKTGKKSTSYFISVYLLTSFGSFDIFINTFDNGVAEATLGDNRGNKINYYGRLLSKEESRIYKGMQSR
jgi:hypothetical protein